MLSEVLFPAALVGSAALLSPPCSSGSLSLCPTRYLLENPGCATLDSLFSVSWSEAAGQGKPVLLESESGDQTPQQCHREAWHGCSQASIGLFLIYAKSVPRDGWLPHHALGASHLESGFNKTTSSLLRGIFQFIGFLVWEFSCSFWILCLQRAMGDRWYITYRGKKGDIHILQL